MSPIIKAIILLFLPFTLTRSSSIVCECDTSFQARYEECSVFIPCEVPTEINRSVVASGKLIKIYIMDCKGKAIVTTLDQAGNLLSKREYLSNDSVSVKTFGFLLDTGTTKIKFYHPELVGN